MDVVTRRVRTSVTTVFLMGILSGQPSCETKRRVTEPADNLDVSARRTAVFQVRWPLIDPNAQRSTARAPLFSGTVQVRTEQPDHRDARLMIHVRLTRSQDDESRQAWNASLIYRELAWMKSVRVWDKQQLWLYPNLAYLFRLHGVDRIERYGGWDPGKQVDNDFGAVLIREYDPAGTQELTTTADQPLVSASWEPVGETEVEGRQTIVHEARSDEFTVHLGTSGEPPHGGKLKLWFIYGDFMRHRVPKDWPQELEFNGGTIAFFHVDWLITDNQSLDLAIRQMVPEHTGFDWESWVGRGEESDPVQGKPRLSNQ